MADDYEFIPKYRRWFVQRLDAGRQWLIQPAEVDENGSIRLCEIIPGRSHNHTTGENGPDGSRPVLFPKAPLAGNEDWSAFCDPVEVQGLMDALWESGMRPTRR